MLMQTGAAEADSGTINQINTTPLVDVMLVLLIIFMITIPVVTTSIPLNLPKQRVEVRLTKPGDVIISVNQAGAIYWHDARLASVAELLLRLQQVSRMDPQPAVHIRGDMAGEFESVGKVLAACQRAGIAKVAFITEPPPSGS